MGVVDLLELICCLWIVRILVGVELQRQLPVQSEARKKTKNQAEAITDSSGSDTEERFVMIVMSQITEQMSHL